MEPIEVHEFAAQMNETREAHEKNMMRVSLIISILAALVAAVTVLGHREHTEAVLLQSRAGDQWQEYQSHKMRIIQLGTEMKMLTLQPAKDAAAAQSAINDDRTQVNKWQSQADDEGKKARDLGADVDRSESRAARFDLGEAFLQIAVVLASITLLTRHRRYVITGCVIGLVGVIAVASAFLIH